jgi:hypothetical protein
VISVAVLVALAACSGGGDTDKAPVDTNPPPFGSDTGYGVPSGGAPALDLAGVEAALEEGIRQVRSMDPVDVLDLVEQLLNYQDPGSCPSNTPTNNDYYDLGRPGESCTASSNAFFQVDLRFKREPAGQDGSVYQYEDAAIRGGSRIVDPLGSTLDFSLVFSHEDRTSSGGNRKLFGTWFGVANWSDAAEGEWLGTGASAGFEYLWVTGSDGVTPLAFTAMGGISGMQGTVVDTTVFSGVFGVEYPDAVLGFTLAGSALGSLCETEPHGSVHLRTHAGEWYEVRFDAPVLGQAPQSDAECDGCATVLFNGTEMGEICPDLAMFLDWQGRPW